MLMSPPLRAYYYQFSGISNNRLASTRRIKTQYEQLKPEKMGLVNRQICTTYQS